MAFTLIGLRSEIVGFPSLRLPWKVIYLQLANLIVSVF